MRWWHILFVIIALQSAWIALILQIVKRAEQNDCKIRCNSWHYDLYSACAEMHWDTDKHDPFVHINPTEYRNVLCYANIMFAFILLCMGIMMAFVVPARAVNMLVHGIFFSEFPKERGRDFAKNFFALPDDCNFHFVPIRRDASKK